MFLPLISLQLRVVSRACWLWLCTVSIAAAQEPELLRDFSPGPFSSSARGFRELNGAVYFQGYAPATGQEPWTSDGTPAGTVPLADIRPGPGSSLDVIGGWRPVEFQGYLYFSANDGVHGAEIWRTDGTPGGTALFVDVEPGPGSSEPTFAVVNGRLVFAATTAAIGRELWVSDGSVLGTQPLFEFQPGPAVAEIRYLPVDGKLFLQADDGVHGSELWVTDGTAAGTRLVSDLTPGPAGTNIIPGMVSVGSRYLFKCNASSLGIELWATDGTTLGTGLVRDIQPGSASSSPQIASALAACLPNGVVFTADDGAHGREPWFSDGTSGGTFMLVDIAPGSPSSSAYVGLANSQTALFVASSPTLGSEPWLSDGTTAGTFPVELNPGTADGAQSGGRVYQFGGQAFFPARNSSGFGLGASDGTVAGTRFLKSLAPGQPGTMLAGFYTVDDAALFFNQGIGAYSNGELDFTKPIPTPSGAPSVGFVSEACRVGDNLFLTAHRSDVGHELFRLPFDVDGDGIFNYVDELNALSFCECTAPVAPCGNSAVGSGCTGSVGQGAHLSATGSTIAGADDLVLRVGPVGANTFGILIISADTAPALTVGNGVLCLGGSLWRLGLANAGPAGELVFGPGLIAQTQGGAPSSFQFDAGETWSFQTWFRDNGGPCGLTSNASDAIQITFTP